MAIRGMWGIFSRVLIGALALVACLLFSAAASAAEPRLLLIANNPVRPGLLSQMEALGREAGVRVAARHAHELGGSAERLEAGADLTLFFAPAHERDDQALVEALCARAAELGAKAVFVQRDEVSAVGVAPERAERLAAYLSEGGPGNLRAFFAYLTGPLLGRHDEAVPEPRRFPDLGIYHPRYDGLIFDDLDAYRQWYAQASGHDWPLRAPVIGVAVHDSHVRYGLTDWIDATVAHVEAAGAVPLVFYFPEMAPPENGMAALLRENGETVVDALLNYRITLNPEGRRDDLERLGVPVLQGLYTPGDEAEWRADPEGYPRTRTPVYFATAEMAGITDPTVVAAERASDRQLVPIEPELGSLVRRALNHAALARLDNADKRLGIYLYNYPPGRGNFSASHLNVPESLAAFSAALEEAGYAVRAVEAQRLVEAGRQLVNIFYPVPPDGPERQAGPEPRSGPERDEARAALEALEQAGLAERFPMAEYLAWLERQDPALRDAVEAQWGGVERARTWVEDDGEAYFVIPRLSLGNAVVLPQPPRHVHGEGAEHAHGYHDTDLPFSHDYLAGYAWLQARFGAHALIHFGTHGTAEYGPGKARGLARGDAPHTVIGELPHVYPYIVDNLAEATLARRRARATIVSHQTPPFAPAALYFELVDLHDLVHDWEQMDDGAARRRVGERILELGEKLGVNDDLGHGGGVEEAEFPAYLERLHDYIHELAVQSEPLGLHTFGRPARDEHLIATVMQMLGEPYYSVLEPDAHEREALFSGDAENAVQDSLPYQVLHRALIEGAPSDDPALQPWIERGDAYLADLRQQNELPALLAALEGRFIEPSVGGDPLRNPDSLPTGRNLYGFDPSRVPTRAAYQTGAELFEELLAGHIEVHGRPPRRIAFSLWAMEAMRHHGVIEGQALAALGVEPRWDERGRLAGVRVIPQEELGRPRVDVVLQATGLYRDSFADAMALLAKAVAEVAALDEPDNPVRRASRVLENRLRAAGLDAEDARRLSLARLFSSASGEYGSGMADVAADVDAWSGAEGNDEAALGRVFLERFDHVYGPDPAHWGERVPQLDLFAAQLAGVESAVLARSSNLFGLLSSDDPFSYLGGLSAAVHAAGGERPALMISNLRDPGGARIETASHFLSRELRTRYHHPRWLTSMMEEGYAGTTQLQATVDNLWGWQATAPERVRDDQWQRFHDIYLRDAYELGLEAWFREHNPEAFLNMTERMLDAVRTGHWDADDATRRSLAELHREWRQLAEHVPTSAAREAFIADLAADFDSERVNNEAATGFGREGPAPQAVPVVGELIQPLPEAPPEPGQAGASPLWRELAYLIALALLVAAGMAHQWRRAHAHSASLHQPVKP